MVNLLGDLWFDGADGDAGDPLGGGARRARRPPAPVRQARAAAAAARWATSPSSATTRPPPPSGRSPCAPRSPPADHRTDGRITGPYGPAYAHRLRGEALTSASGSPTTASGRTGSTMQGHVDAAEARARLGELAVARRPHDAVFADFLAVYYDALPADDVDEHDIDDLYAVAVAHYDLGRVRRRGVPLVRVSSPEHDGDAWSATHSGVLVVTDDMPFLVDTMRMVLERHGLASTCSCTRCCGRAATTHARWSRSTLARRHRDDRTTAGGCSRRGRRSRSTASTATAADELEAELRRRGRRRPPRRRRLRARCAHRMEALASIDPILPWLADGQFVFLGAVDYDVADDGARDAARRERARPRAEACNADTLAKVCFPTSVGRRDADRPSIARTDDVSTVFRRRAPDGRHRRPTPPTRRAAPLRRAAGDQRLPGERAATSRASATRSPTPSTSARRGARATPGGPPAPCSRACRATSCSRCEPTALAACVGEIVGLQERQLVRVFEVPEPVGPWITVLVYLPARPLHGRAARARRRHRRRRLRRRAAHVRVRRRRQLAGPHRGQRALRPSRRRVGRPRRARAGDRRAVDVVVGPPARRARRRASASERAARPVRRASAPAPRRRTVAAVAAGAGDRRPAPRRRAGRRRRRAWPRRSATTSTPPAGEWRFRVYRRGTPMTLSELLPLLDHLGVQALDERPYTFRARHRAGLPVRHRRPRAPTGVGARRAPGAADVRRRRSPGSSPGVIESDGFNRLVLRAGLRRPRGRRCVRAYGKYLRQIGFAFSQRVHRGRRSPSTPALVARPRRRCSTPASTRPVAARRPTTARGGGAVGDDRSTRSTPSPASTTTASAGAFLTLIDATVRTNYYRGRPAIAVKLDPAADPRPARCRGRSTRSGCARRGSRASTSAAAPIARGGLRWSDRREDFRTEVLGLMKAQMVKNAVIVPDGAKGGFVVKRPPPTRRRCATEVVECYQTFVRGLLDLTDNLVAGARRATRPTPCVHDGDDPYLVVAADKGTATFSDIANEIAAEYGFWLGDAFASGGSAGYDHKEMGITARGRVGERAPPRPRARQRRRPRPADRRRHRRHVGRRVRQRDAALAARCGSSPRSTTATCSSIPIPIPRRRFAERRRLFDAAPFRRGPTTTRRCSRRAAASTRAR